MDHPAEQTMTTGRTPAPHASTDLRPADAVLESIRLQAEEHPLVGDLPAASASEHCLRLMHLKAYEEAATFAAERDVLDVGCNTGYGTLRFLDMARRVVGVDVSPRAIEAASAASIGGRPEFLTTDGLNLPFPDASFDLVVSFQVVEHIVDPVPYLRELGRVSRPGGIVVLTTPNAATRLYPGMTPWNRFHVREYRASELDELLRSVYPQVRIRGMFGTATLYETEIDRVDATRRHVRRAEAIEQAALAAERAGLEAAGRPSNRRRRPLPIRVARAIVPSGARSWLRSVARRRPGVPRPHPSKAGRPTASSDRQAMDLETFRRFSAADLFFADTDLDRAMDLMAVCRLD